ncbi:outer membrane protein assembly factor BamE [Pseudooceanicola spongiae]|jgi:outer membrane protein assembly factor BamE (lipoprotein component of BamABCDE complex)|uniref:Outer membrane protein assembly factor BamE n=1 Tax=Pseudooceanicola spongiae TaxID=2613965 RepID=A0A7L9WIT6_9RHOB|nr:outer membrane protein assembly factor BamE [Pseudooceanicola spongiae]QOL80311.1 outer membrane protein assembly factor BamE [Pseudooceanicola spongiae]
MARNKIRAGWLVSLVAIAGLSGCSAQFRNHGYMPDADQLSQITIGVDTRPTVEEVAGPPTTAGVLKDSSLYYVRSRVRHYAFTRPTVVSREVLAVSFNPSGTVRNIETFGLEKGQVVPLTRRVTDSSTADKTFIRQLMGNIGNFDAASVLGAE